MFHFKTKEHSVLTTSSSTKISILLTYHRSARFTYSFAQLTLIAKTVKSIRSSIGLDLTLIIFARLSTTIIFVLNPFIGKLTHQTHSI